MCFNVFQCAKKHIEQHPTSVWDWHWHWKPRDHLFSMCEKHIEKTLKAHWRTLGKTHWKTHWKALEHIITHCTLQHIGDSAAFSNVPPMCPILNVQKTHWKNWRHIDAHFNVPQCFYNKFQLSAGSRIWVFVAEGSRRLCATPGMVTALSWWRQICGTCTSQGRWVLASAP